MLISEAVSVTPTEGMSLSKTSRENGCYGSVEDFGKVVVGLAGVSTCGAKLEFRTNGFWLRVFDVG